MNGYRIKHPDDTEQSHKPLAPEAVAGVVSDVMQAKHFFVAKPVAVELLPPQNETTRWEIFRGQLLDYHHTREEKNFLSWNAFLIEGNQRSGEPILSIKFDSDEGKLHIVRGLHCYVWQGYSEGNVYLTKETTKWIRELVGTVDLRLFPTEQSLRDELGGRLFEAVVGVSRLPLTSVESPLPGFTFGRFGYVYRSADLSDATQPMTDWRVLLYSALQKDLSYDEKVKTVELALRAASDEELPELARLFGERWATVSEHSTTHLLWWIFRNVSLSPYTNFVDHLLQFVRLLVEDDRLQEVEEIDFLSSVLRQIGRHLTAYDLETFHHFGANYPDALLLDAFLKRYLELIELHPSYLMDDEQEPYHPARTKRQRRRALRQAWYFRMYYDGLPVPDAPTSPGENRRVLPAPHGRVPEEQITQVIKRRKKLYEGDPLAQYFNEQTTGVLKMSFEDLQHPFELRELGAALFIDRPIGLRKAPGEADQTHLFAHLAYSKSIAQRRLSFMQSNSPFGEQLPWQVYADKLKSLSFKGIPANQYRDWPARVVSLADASRLTDDFVLHHTVYESWNPFLHFYRWTEQLNDYSLEFLTPSKCVLIVPDPASTPDRIVLNLYDCDYRKRVEFIFDLSKGYTSMGGHEYPAAGMTLGAFLPAKVLSNE